MGLPRHSRPSEMGPNSSNRCELDGDGATASREGEYVELWSHFLLNVPEQKLQHVPDIFNYISLANIKVSSAQNYGKTSPALASPQPRIIIYKALNTQYALLLSHEDFVDILEIKF